MIMKYMKSVIFVFSFLVLLTPIGIEAITIPNLPEAAISHMAVCPQADGQSARCHARVVTDRNGSPSTTSLPAGMGPSQFHGAYASATASSEHQVIAIVDAYNHPNILSDLNTYSATFGIPPMASCPVATGTVSSPCFEKVDQRGGNQYPATNAGWALEIALDVEVAHAMCQNCSILLVEADSNSFANLMAAVDRAVAMNAAVVSNSYGASEFSTETNFDSHFNHTGIAITVSSGDSGYGVEYPASSQYVTAVGGTTLTLSGNNYVSESAWSGSGSGCSLYESKPAFQSDAACSKRTVADVSADANPNTGAAVYDSIRYQGRRGWFKVGGTSLAAPLVAGVYALAGGVPSGAQGNALPYAAAPGTLHDVTTGSNGSCGGLYLCTATVGFDGPTGLGTPNGLGAF